MSLEVRGFVVDAVSERVTFWEGVGSACTRDTSGRALAGAAASEEDGELRMGVILVIDSTPAVVTSFES